MLVQVQVLSPAIDMMKAANAEVSPSAFCCLAPSNGAASAGREGISSGHHGRSKCQFPARDEYGNAERDRLAGGDPLSFADVAHLLPLRSAIWATTGDANRSSPAFSIAAIIG